MLVNPTESVAGSSTNSRACGRVSTKLDRTKESSSEGKDWHPADYRVFNVPHQVASYYAMYVVSRNYEGFGDNAGGKSRGRRR